MKIEQVPPNKAASSRRAKPWASYRDFGRLLFIIGWSFFAPAFFASAQTIRTVGPVDIYFYNSGQSDEDGASTQNWTGQQIEDITASIAAWANSITNTPGRQVKLHLFWENLGSTILGSTSDPSVGDGATVWTNNERVWRFGDNYSGSTSYDARIAFSTGVSWNFGPAAPDFSHYDFRSVITHEFGHTLGFSSTYNPVNDRFSSSGLSEWDKRLRDSAGNRPVVNGTGTPGNFNQVDNPVYFTGANAVAAYGGNVPVYAPNPYQSGSSLSHLDEALLPNALMSPQLGPGEAIRAATPLEWAILQDLTWSVASSKSWTKGGGTLNWSTTTNWSPSGLPTAAWNVLFTNTGLTSGDTINLGADRTINSLLIDCTTNFSIGGSTGNLILNSGFITRSAASTGTQTIARPLSIGANTVWDISGTGSLTIVGSLTATNNLTKVDPGMVVLAGSANIPGSLNIDDGDWTLASGGSLTVNNLTGLGGSLNFDGGTLNLTGSNNLHLYGIRVGKDTIGSFTLLPGKTLTTDVFLTIGRDSGGQGTFINQSTVNASTNLFVGANAGSSGYYLQQASANPADPLPSTNVVSATFIGYSGGAGLLEMRNGTYNTVDFQTGYGSAGTFTQSGGTVNVTGIMGIGNTAGVQGIINLTGGTLNINNLTVGSGTATFNFGGGTMRATGAFATSAPFTLTGTGGDAKIDTQGFAVTLANTLTGSGGLQKLGAGTLTLAATANYLGATTISTGNLLLTGTTFTLHAITGGGNLAVGNGAATPLLTADSIKVNALSVAAGSKIKINATAGGPLSLTGFITPVPEPSTATLLLLAGLIGILYCNRGRPLGR